MYYGITETHYNEETKIWSGPKKKDLYGPDMTIGEVALFVLSRNPDKVIQVMDTTGEQLTAAQLIRQSKLVAKNLLQFGLKLGDVVGISANNTAYLSSVLMGALLCGAPTNALYPGFDKGESVQIIFKVTTPKIIFCDVENYKLTREAVEEINLNAEIFLMNGEIEGVHNVKELLVDDGSDLERISFPCTKLNGDDTAVILCSSGTTGSPKGVLGSHKVLINMPIYLNLSPDSVLFTFSTLYWASGLWTYLTVILSGVKLVVTDKPFTPEYFLQLVEKHRITNIISGPLPIAQIIQNAEENTRQRLSSIRTILCAGSKVSQVISEKMNAILGDEERGGLVVAYGMSELSTMLTENDAGPGKRREGSEGKLLPNTEVRIVDKNGVLLGVNSPGLLNIRTPHKWSGYYRNTEATTKSNVNGWLVTGDIGYFDEDGFLHICSRHSDVFKSSGFRIYPQRIEEVVMQVPGVLEACVFGVPDFVAGNLTACAVVRTDNDKGRHITEADIVEHVKQKMAICFHIKAGVYFVEALPKTCGSGKVQRRKVFDIIQKAVN